MLHRVAQTRTARMSRRDANSGLAARRRQSCCLGRLAAGPGQPAQRAPAGLRADSGHRQATAGERTACDCGTSPTRPGCTLSTSIPPTPEKYYVESAPGRARGLRLQQRRPAGHFLHERRGNAIAREDVRDVRQPAVPERRRHALHRRHRRRRHRRGRLRHGRAAADYDNDGHVDLFVAGVRTNQLLRNRGDGTFEDVTARAGIAQRRLGCCRRLVRLRQRRPAGSLCCELRPVVAPTTIATAAIRPWSSDLLSSAILCPACPNRLYRNRWQTGRFEDVSARAGILAHMSARA